MHRLFQTLKRPQTANLVRRVRSIAAQPVAEQQLPFAFNNLQGRRAINEDRVLCAQLDSETRVFGVFDGNSGPDASEFISKHILDILIGEYRMCNGDVGAAIAKSILAADLAFGRTLQGQMRAGTTATIAVVNDTEIVVGHVGDSRAIVVGSRGITMLTTDHRPTNDAERKRVLKAGGKITWNGAPRLGGLSMTRCLGCFHLRSMGLVNTPDIVVHHIDPHTDIALVLVTDGVFDFARVEAVGELAGSADTPDHAVAAITHLALDTNNSKDNVSSIVVALPAWGKTSLQRAEIFASTAEAST